MGVTRELSSVKDIRRIYREMERQGCLLEVLRTNHVRIRWPSGDVEVQPSTPGNPQAAIKHLRRRCEQEAIDL